jgi:hypothetical protein
MDVALQRGSASSASTIAKGEMLSGWSGRSPSYGEKLVTA